jgi:hypothetical protein
MVNQPFVSSTRNRKGTQIHLNLFQSQIAKQGCKALTASTEKRHTPRFAIAMVNLPRNPGQNAEASRGSSGEQQGEKIRYSLEAPARLHVAKPLT